MSEQLIGQMRDARLRTLALVEDLPDEKFIVSKMDVVNPFLWELGHVAFFYDAFVRGYLDGSPCMLDRAERMFDSFEVDHDVRWDLRLPSRGETLEYMSRVVASLEERLGARQPSAQESYCYQLSILHEDMHGEAFTYMRQTLGYARPTLAVAEPSPRGALPGDVDVPGGRFELGSDPERDEFVFDNEKWGHPVDVASFKIARAPVTNAQFAEFITGGGYADEELWGVKGLDWLRRTGVDCPEYWIRREGDWCSREFDRETILQPDHPVRHVSFFEAEAFCRWAGRRLPTEAEWEMAASLDPSTGEKLRYPWGEDSPTPDHANLDTRVMGTVDVADHPAGDSPSGCRQMLGNVWEWTASAFYPFPGYIVDLPYREYSAPWFGYRKVLKGGAFATRSRLVTNTHRNFFDPNRRDVFGGFRTCAL